MHGNCWKIARVDCEVAFGVLWREGSVSNFCLSGGGLVILQKGKTKLPKYQCVLGTFIEPATSCLFILFSEDNKKSEPITTFQVVVVVLQCPNLAESSQRLQVTTYKKKISYYGNYEHHSKFRTRQTIDDVQKPSKNPNCSKPFHAV